MAAPKEELTAIFAPCRKPPAPDGDRLVSILSVGVDGSGKDMPAAGDAFRAPPPDGTP